MGLYSFHICFPYDNAQKQIMYVDKNTVFTNDAVNKPNERKCQPQWKQWRKPPTIHKNHAERAAEEPWSVVTLLPVVSHSTLYIFNSICKHKNQQKKKIISPSILSHTLNEIANDGGADNKIQSSSTFKNIKVLLFFFVCVWLHFYGRPDYVSTVSQLSVLRCAAVCMHPSNIRPQHLFWHEIKMGPLYAACTACVRQAAAARDIVF